MKISSLNFHFVSSVAPACFTQCSSRVAVLVLASTAFAFAAPQARAQAVWTNADDRNYDNTGKFVGAYWSFGFVAPDANGNNGHAGNWSGNLVPGKGGPTDVYLGAPGNTLCDVNVTLNSLTLAPGGGLALDISSSLTVTTTNLATDGTITVGGGGGAFPSFTNTGTLTKTAGTGTTAFAGDITFNSTPGSTIAVNSGTLQLPGQGGLFDTVTFDPAAGAVIDLVSKGASSAFTNLFQGMLSNGAGTGIVRFSKGTMAGTGRNNVANPQPCVLAFTGSVFQWTGGSIGDYQQGAVFTNAGVVNAVADASPTLFAALTNQGLLAETGAGGLILGNNNSGGSLTNAATGIVDLRSDAGIGYGGGNGNFFTNAGLFKKSAGTGTSTVAPNLTFNNQGGTVEADSGTLVLSNNGASTGGTYNAAAGAILDLGNGNFTGLYTGSGAGTVRLSQGTLNSDQQNGATFNFPGALFQWTGGTLGGYQSGQVFNNVGTINLSGSGDKVSYAKLTNNGLMVQTGAGNFVNGYYNGGTSFTNAAGGVYDLQSDAAIAGDPYPFRNAGLFKKSAGAGTSTMTSQLTNTGTVAVYTGTLTFRNGVDDINNTTLTEGTWNVYDGATLSFQNYPSVTVNQAVVSLSGVNSSFPALRSLADNQGSLSLLALRQFATVGNFANEGALSLEAGCTMHVGGDFTASGANSMLAITVGGAASQGSGSPGVLQANGAATLAGKLSLTFAENAVLPGSSDTLTILSAVSSLSGSFANVASGNRLTTTDGRGSFRVNYDAGTHAVVLSDFLLPGQMDVPTATLSALVPSVAANSGQDGEFLLTLSSTPTSDVVVNFTIKGTAVNGTDYVLLKATKKIKAGKTSKPIKVIPQGDLGGASKKTVVLTLQPGTGYQVGTTGKVKVKIIN